MTVAGLSQDIETILVSDFSGTTRAARLRAAFSCRPDQGGLAVAQLDELGNPKTCLRAAGGTGLPKSFSSLREAEEEAKRLSRNSGGKWKAAIWRIRRSFADDFSDGGDH